MKKTVGQASLELMEKGDEKINPIDLQRAIHKGNKPDDSYEANLLNCLERGKQALGTDFFIEVQVKKERLMKNVIRNYFMFKQACPTPQLDQTVYHYHSQYDTLEFLWVVPDCSTLEMFTQNIPYIPADQFKLLEFCLDFKAGRLDQKAKELNNEFALKPESQLLLE